jgi:apolipoprotein N-acyltransferase
MDLSVPVRTASPPAAGMVGAGTAHARIQRAVAAVLSGLLLYLAFPPVGFWPLAPFAVAGLALCCRGVRARHGAALGLLHGLALFLPLVEWTRTIAGLPALVALALLQALFLGLLGAALAVVVRRAGWPVWTAALWVGEEALRARLPFGGFPWGRLAFSQGDTPLTPLAGLGGAPLVTFCVGLLGGVLAWAALLLARRGDPVHRRTAAVTAPVLLLVLVGLALAPSLTPSAGGAGGPTTTVAIVQGNVPRLGLDFNAQRAAVLTNHVEATRQLAADVRAGRTARPDLVVWPENASDIDPFTDAEAGALIDGAVRDIGVPTLVGAVLQGPGDQVSNAGIVWDPQTGPGEVYVKRHPVPFGEYIPYRSLVRRLTDKVDLVPRDFAAGREPGVLEVGPVVLGDVICFEVAYDDLVRDVVTGGGRLLVVQTNNATFGRSGESAQQLAMGRLRAVEHGRSVLVAATSGISAVITPDGQVQQRSAIFTRDVLVADVPLGSALTPATRLGALPELVLALAGAAAVGLALAAARVPTYDEADNLLPLATRLHAAVPDVHLLVVDDNSPDGTGKLADELAAMQPWAFVLHRSCKAGLGAAYIAGFAWAREHGYAVVVEMDADGSHAPEELPRLLAALVDADLVLGSRWVPGGRVVNWPRSRELLSRGGNAYTRVVLGLPLCDVTGGFRAYRRSVLDGLPLAEVSSQGYCFQVDLAWRTWRRGHRVVEVPITFVERERGESKMSRAIVAEALWRGTWWGLGRQVSRRRTPTSEV